MNLPANCVHAFAWFRTSSLLWSHHRLADSKKNVLVLRFFLLFSLLDVPYINTKRKSFRHRVDHRRGRVAGTVVPEGQPSTSVPGRLGAINGRLAIRSSSDYGHPTPSCWCLLREIWSHSYVLYPIPHSKKQESRCRRIGCRCPQSRELLVPCCRLEWFAPLFVLTVPANAPGELGFFRNLCNLDGGGGHSLRGETNPQ